MDNLEKRLEDLEKQIQVTEDQIQGIYMYLSAFMEQMNDEEVEMWKTILEKYDPEFKDQEDD